MKRLWEMTIPELLGTLASIENVAIENAFDANMEIAERIWDEIRWAEEHSPDEIKDDVTEIIECWVKQRALLFSWPWFGTLH
jgi:hypothetical protein